MGKRFLFRCPIGLPSFSLAPSTFCVTIQATPGKLRGPRSDIRVELRALRLMPQLEALRQREIDCAFLYTPPPEGDPDLVQHVGSGGPHAARRPGGSFTCRTEVDEPQGRGQAAMDHSASRSQSSRRRQTSASRSAPLGVGTPPAPSWQRSSAFYSGWYREYFYTVRQNSRGRSRPRL
jgi:hypothetical protein